jgi:hypothetical protein
MRITTITTCLFASSLAIAGCADEADMGIDSDPVTCATDGALADMAGTVSYDGRTFRFDNGYPSATYNTDGGVIGVSLWSSDNPDTQIGNSLRFDFVCGTPTRGTYAIAGSERQQDPSVCPFSVASAVSGSIEYLPASGGTLIIDETDGCLAGRFRADLSGFGAVGGWFSIPNRR